jgi:hypothetical protein
VGKVCAGQNIAAPAFTQTFTAGKGRLWRSEGVAEQDLDELRAQVVKSMAKGRWGSRETGRLDFHNLCEKEGMAQSRMDWIGSAGFGSTRADPIITTVVKRCLGGEI